MGNRDDEYDYLFKGKFKNVYFANFYVLKYFIVTKCP